MMAKDRIQVEFKLRGEEKYILNPNAFVVRVSPNEIAFTYGVLKTTVLSITCRDARECDSLESVLMQLRSPKTLDEIRAACEESGVDFWEFIRLRDVGLLIPESAMKVSMVYPKATFQKFDLILLRVRQNGDVVANSIVNYLEDLGLRVSSIEIQSTFEGLDEKLRDIDPHGSILLISLDHWSPYVLKTLNRRLMEKEYSFVPVYRMMEVGIIGPYVSKGTACYECFEYQMLSSWGLVSAFNIIRSYLDNPRPGSEPSGVILDAVKNFVYPKALNDFFCSLASLIVAQLAAGNQEILLNRVIAVDFSNIYIDAVRVYSLPSCFHNKVYVSLEF